ncbi:hypothetical protein SAMN05192529_12347 [Arachidicoccus rhizosphaerae]|uniref:Adhesin n=1 Tax=Arachidicoccus rhizosphaerae TaxID=551991 RepID=A0A1H4BR69_9BACT|nr:hypothetical protein [Arachidicoccus rhizosphaerae]SEA50342.1 hypothetical protein SAMN05192529_12347 [Arachidicoccus rhizosphaerae]
MRKLVFASICAGLAAFSLSCISVESNGVHFKGQSEEISLMTKSFNAGSIGNVKAITSGGNISIDGDAVGQATIEVLGRGNNGKNYSKEEIMEILKNDYEFSVDKEGNTLTAIARRTKSGSWNKSVSISYIIHVSHEVATDLKTSGGNIRLSALKGDQNFSTSGGNIRFDGLSGQVTGRTSGGNIEATQSGGDIQATTSGGNIKMEDLKGNIEMRTSGGNISGNSINGNLSVSTSGGNISLADIAATLKGNTSGGMIKADFSSFQNNASLSTSGGNISLSIPANTKMNFDIKGSHVSMAQVNGLQVQINKQKDHATGQLNGGGPSLDARTSGGTVKIDFGAN